MSSNYHNKTIKADNQLTQWVKCVQRHRRRIVPMGKLAVVGHDDVRQWLYVFVYPFRSAVAVL